MKLKDKKKKLVTFADAIELIHCFESWSIVKELHIPPAVSELYLTVTYYFRSSLSPLSLTLATAAAARSRWALSSFMEKQPENNLISSLLPQCFFVSASAGITETIQVPV